MDRMTDTPVKSLPSLAVGKYMNAITDANGYGTVRLLYCLKLMSCSLVFFVGDYLCATKWHESDLTSAVKTLPQTPYKHMYANPIILHS